MSQRTESGSPSPVKFWRDIQGSGGGQRTRGGHTVGAAQVQPSGSFEEAVPPHLHLGFQTGVLTGVSLGGGWAARKLATC